LDLALTALGNRITAHLGGGHRIIVFDRANRPADLIELDPALL